MSPEALSCDTFGRKALASSRAFAQGASLGQGAGQRAAPSLQEPHLKANGQVVRAVLHVGVEGGWGRKLCWEILHLLLKKTAREPFSCLHTHLQMCTENRVSRKDVEQYEPICDPSSALTSLHSGQISYLL